MSWYLEDPERLLRERDEIEALCAASPWLLRGEWVRLDDELAFDFDMEVGGKVYEARLVYPDLFPDAAGWVIPRKKEMWSGHQFVDGGPLCLDIRPDNWHWDYTGAMLINSAYRLVSIEKPGPDVAPGIAPSAHRSTQAEAIRNNDRRVIVSPAAVAGLRGIEDNGMRKIVFATPLETSGQRATLMAMEQDGARMRFSDVPDFNAYKVLRAIEYEGWAFRSNWSDAPSHFSSNGALLAYLVGHQFIGFFPMEKLDTVLLVVFVDEAGPVRVLALTADLDAAPVEYALIIADESRRLPADIALISTRRIALIGCGSVGSKIAVSLARSGARRFHLFDHDVFRPENLLRNELDWWHVGMHKVKALRDRLNMVAAGMDVITSESAPGAAGSSRYMSYAYEAIGASDLIIDATARALVFERLAGVARRRAKPMIWGELFAGGIGGLVARSRPNLDGAPLQVRSSMLDYLETLPEAPSRGAIDYDDIDTAEPLIATDADVSFLASAMSQMALDTLVESSRFPYSAYLFGLRAEWIFQGPFEFQPIATSKLESLPVPADPSAVAAAASFFQGLNAAA